MIKYNAYDVQVASKTDPAARYVLASDYAALEAELKDVRLAVVRLKMGFDHIQAERDELKRRIEKIRDWINENNDDGLHLWLLAIAEGRDNG